MKNAITRLTRKLTLTQRLSAVFAVLLLACCGASAWLQIMSNQRHEQELIQRLSMGLAAHIAGNAPLMESGGPNPAAVRSLFGKLMDVNPSVEVYLLGPDGQIQAQAAPPGHLKRDRVDVAPIRQLLEGAELPVFGDDPRSNGARKVFSAAPLQVDGRDAGFVYVVLLGEDHDAIAQHIGASNTLRITLWSIALMAALSLLAGLTAFAWITRPLRRLTLDVHRFQATGSAQAGPPESAMPTAIADDLEDTGNDEIRTLRRAFASMTQRIADQWRELTSQDRQRRDMVANISHDLRTPLTSLHGYLETLRVKADTLSDADRKRYLDVAIGQSRKVGHLAQALFELARLESGAVKPEIERFSLPELVQDVFQKFELAAEAKQIRLTPDIGADVPMIAADVGMIERVLTNLLDNAIRHTPIGGEVEVKLRRDDSGVAVQIADNGPGVPPPMHQHLFERPSFQTRDRNSSGGLGLVIVQRILQLHDSEIRLAQTPTRQGATFQFKLAA
ncbi:sensor histidine kinase [soil metagenome]